MQQQKTANNMIGQVLMLAALALSANVNGEIQTGDNDFTHSNAGGVETRVIGGQPADKGQFPWHVVFNTDDLGFCNGALIHENWVLTTAKCVAGVSNFTLTFGMVDIYDMESEAQYVDSTIAFVHPDYDNLTLIHDIALIQLDRSLDFSPVNVTLIAPIRTLTCQERTASLTAAIATLSGWGKNPAVDEAAVSSNLNFIPNMVVMDNQDCSSAFGMGNVFSSQLCTSGLGTVGACDNDEGGPLVTSVDDEQVLIGLASFIAATGCDNGAPTVYTRVGDYLDWIHETMGDECDVEEVCKTCGAGSVQLAGYALLALVVVAARHAC